MINKNDLRIGNYCFSPENENVIIERIEKEWCGVRTKGDGIFHQAYDCPTQSLLPILLTPEILLACGFEFDGEMYEYTKGGDLRFTLEEGILVPHEYYTFQPFTEKAYPKYLHQLQNLIWVLTGEELKVKL